MPFAGRNTIKIYIRGAVAELPHIKTRRNIYEKTFFKEVPFCIVGI